MGKDNTDGKKKKVSFKYTVMDTELAGTVQEL